MIRINEKQKKLYDLLWKIPTNMAFVDEYIKNEKYSAEDVSIVGLCYVDECFGEGVEIVEYDEKRTIEAHAPYLYDTVKLLLKHGLDPNMIYEDMNIMQQLRFIETKYVAADTLGILLENGGRYDLAFDGEILFDEIDFDVVFGAIEQENRGRYDSLVHCWLVLIGYGATLRDGRVPVTLYPEFDNKNEPIDISKFKNHKEYTYALTYVPGNNEKWSLHIIDKKTMWEVARL